MRIVSLLLLAVCATLFSACDDKEPQKIPFYTGRVYESVTAKADSVYLQSFDPSNMSDSIKEVATLRKEEIEAVLAYLRQSLHVQLEYGRCIPPIIIPPGPCAYPGELRASIPTGTAIQLTLLGCFTQFPDNSSMRIVTKNDAVFAEGELKEYEGAFQTAWYTFTVKDSAFAQDELLLRVHSQISDGQKPQDVSFEIPIPAGTFIVE